MPAKLRTSKRKQKSSAVDHAGASEDAVRAPRNGDAAAGSASLLQDTEKALVISTERYRLLAIDSAAIVWTTDAQGAFLSAISHWEEFSGARELEMRGHGWLEQVHPDDRAAAEVRWLQAVEAKCRYVSEYRLRRGGVEWRHMLARATPLFSADGQVEEWVGLCEDITERKRAEQLIALEHRVLRSLADADDETTALRNILRAVCEIQGWEYGRYWQADADADVLRAAGHWCAPAADSAAYLEDSCALTVVSGVGIVGRAWRSALPLWMTQGDGDPSDEQSLFAPGCGRCDACVFPINSAGATIGLLSFVSSEMRAPDERLLATFGLIGDQVGQFLQRKRRDVDLMRFRAAMDISSDSIWLIDRGSMRFIDVNATACELLGYSRSELLGLGPPDLSPNQGQDFEHDYDELIAGNTAPTASERMLRRKDGTLVLVEARRCAVLSGGRWIIVGISRDLSDRVAAAKALRESDEDFRTLAESMPQIVLVFSPDGACIYINRRWTEDIGQPVQCSYGHGWLQVVHRDDRRLCADIWRRSLVNGEAFEAEFRVCVPDGSYRWKLARGLAMRDAAGRVLKWFGTWTDIDDHKQDERIIRHHAMQQNLIAAFGQKALANIDLDELLTEAAVVAVNGLKVEFCKLLQLAPDGRSFTLKAGAGWQPGWIGRRIADCEVELQNRYVRAAREAVIVSDFRDESTAQSSDILEAHAIRSGIEVPIAGVNGVYGVLGTYSRELRRFTPADVDFLLSLANTIATAIGRKDAEQRLTYLAQFDALTGLPNRRLFLDRVALTLTQAQRNQQLVGIMFADLDYFKAVNDTLGHGLGDQLLVQVAQRLLACTRSADTVARLGGDEFAIMLSSLAKIDDAMLVAQKIVDALSRAFDLDGQEAYISASLGIAIYPDDGVTAELVLKNADTAMYRAKERGRNTYQFYLPQMNERAVARLDLEIRLRGALARNEFLLYYQPKVNLVSGEISGFEALLRWRHPQRGIVSTVEFISILEDTGLIVPIGEWVIRQVCEQLVRWPQEGVRSRPVAVNLSARQFQAKNFGATVMGIMQATAVDPTLLEFELTESMLMSDAETAIVTLKNLKMAGVKVSVDDFGTGYSSLAYIKRFPLDALKIDRAFIRDITTDPDDAMIALAIITLAHSLKLKVVAEGVETEAQIDFLQANGCDEMQGYYFAQPLAIADCTLMLREGRRLASATRGVVA